MLRIISWALWIIGMVLVIGSWVNLVSPELSWFGFLMALVGFAMQYLPGYRKLTTSEEIDRLANLRDEGKITEEEFIQAKQRLLEKPYAG